MHDLVTAETLYDAQGNRLQGTLNTYEAVPQRDDSTSVFPALVSVRQTVYDNAGQGSMSTTVHNTYDAYDRPTKVTLPDGATTATAYAIVDHDGEPMLETRVTDALGRHAESYTDEKGRNRETVQHAANGDVRVRYGYDAVGQVLTVHHPNGKTTTYQYDLLGHKLKVNHPDAGEVTCTYDAAGNLLTKLTAELKKTISDKAAISYTYDYERLSEVLYPKNLFNRVTYTYGKPGAKYNRAGRLELVEDASGGEAYYYGNQGEVVKTVRSVMVSQADVRTYVHAATYDSHNRVRTMTYPDGEVVTYGYDAAGQVTSLKSAKQGREETIVAQVGYDKDGHTIYTRMGNGTESTYAYDRQRERLQGMQLTANGDSIMQTQYKYDPVDNILGLTNVITPKAPKKPKGLGGPGRTDGMDGSDAGKGKEEKPLGGAFSHTYAYDELNRLVKASGKAKGIGYAMDMSFGLMGEPLTKVQRTDSGSVAGSYALAYEYGDTDHPTAPSQIGHERYTYDANGNPTLVEDDSLNTERRMAWDEENRLMALSDNGKTSRYTYNAAGERIVKSHGYLEGVYVNGAPQGLTFHETEDYTIYPAPILSVTRQRFTKHYFIGDRRIASKIGAGIFQNAYGHGANVVTAGQKDYQMRMMQIERQREDYYRKLGTPPGVPTMKGAMAEPENTHEGYNTIIKELGDHSVPDGWIQRPKRNAVPGTPPGPPVQWDKAEDPDDVQPGYGYVPADTAREDIFYYHTDHLGSTSYITDAKANVAQFDAYLPYGELLVDEHSSTEEMPYKFNGKKLDQETGLYYYGARYMNPRTSLWYGVDPLAEKYPSVGGYCYTFGNPLRFIDPTGMAPTEEEAARIADHVYGTGKVRLTGGWKVSKLRFKNVNLKDDRSGFRSELYERTIKGQTEYVYATAGTDFSSSEDWKNDAQQIVGCSKQYEISMQNAERLSKAIGNKELTFVGHSLGGGLAAANAFKTGRRAMTFNAAWVSPFTIAWWNRKKAIIDAFIHYNDELNRFQVNVLGVGADGTQHWRFRHNSMLGHSIQNFYKPDPKPVSETLEQKIQNAQQQYMMNRQNLPFSF